MIRSAALHGSARRRLVLAAARLLLTLRHPALVFRFIRKLGYLPNPAAPRSHHELMLWRKIVDRDPLFVTLTDKLAAKDYIRRICLEMPGPLCRRGHHLFRSRLLHVDQSGYHGG
ncbi:MAG: hypothetical protein E5Y89_22605, partial [Mesorhizobium sp.]